MSLFDVILGVLLIAEGLLFAVYGHPFLEILDLRSRETRNLIAVVCVILGMGVALGSSLSNSPTLVLVLGIGILLAGPGYRLMPAPLWDRTVTWWTEVHLAFYRTIAVIALTLLGGFLILSGLS